MADIQGFKITPLASASVTVPRATIEGRFTDSQTGETLVDLTGANAVTFPNYLSSLSAADRQELIQMVAHWLLHKKAGM